VSGICIIIIAASLISLRYRQLYVQAETEVSFRQACVIPGSDGTTG
jgi:hypothetical protein